jgi:protein-S-isoprenylcysteine O-methyltransferase Ste14
VLLTAFLCRGSWPEIAVGFALAVLGVYFRTMAAGIIKKNEELAASGPYALCRHPLYFGSFLLSLGLAVASHSPVVWGCFIVLFPLFYIPAMKKEEGVLLEKFGARYEEYRGRTPVFLPRPGRLDLADFRWTGVFANREHVNWLVLVLLLLVMAGKKLLT